jgi:Cysteine-rich CPXCG
MKNRRHMPRSPADESTLDPAAIDAKYGLEPVIEPAGEGHGVSESGAVQFTTIQCPYCGEPFDTTVDTSAGSSSYIEDCQVCCRPIEISFEVSSQGELNSVNAQRSD